MKLPSEPWTIAAVGYAVWELTKYVRDRKNFGLTESQDLRQQLVAKKVTDIYNHIMSHHDLNEDRQQRMASTLDDISKNMLKMSVVLDSILNKLNRS